MNYQNQQSQATNSTQLVRLVPFSSNGSYVGTTVSYSLQGGNTVNALNNSNFNSGSFGSNQPSNWSNQGYTNINPSISASQFGQFGSGVSDIYMMNNRRSLLVQPSIDISETSSEIVVSAFVTNGTVNNMNLNITQDSCTISGNVWTGNENLILHRTIPLSTSVRAESCEATLQSGVLEIRLPKMERNSKSKTIIGQDINQA